MCMSTMERRLQILLDAERYDRIAAEAARRGGSVASVVRDAIDIAYPSTVQARVVAIGHLLGHDASGEPDVDFESTRDLLDSELAERFA